MHRIFIAVLLAVLSPALASAQICYGKADLTGERPVQIGAEFTHSDIVTGKGVSIVGGSSSLFGKAQVRHDNYYGVVANATALELGGGFQLAPKEDRRMVFCPEVSITRHFSSDTGSGSNIGISAKVFGGGISGGVVLGNQNFQVVPNAGVWLQRFWPDANTLNAGDRTVGAVRVGAGIVLSQRVSIAPSMGFPFRSPESKKYFALGVYFSIGE
jgi:hypothetical protein